MTTSLAPAGVQGKTEAIAPRRRLPYPRTPRLPHPPDRAGTAWGGVRLDRRSLTPRSAPTANLTPQALPKDLKGGAEVSAQKPGRRPYPGPTPFCSLNCQSDLDECHVAAVITRSFDQRLANELPHSIAPVTLSSRNEQLVPSTCGRCDNTFLRPEAGQ